MRAATSRLPRRDTLPSEIRIQASRAAVESIPLLLVRLRALIRRPGVPRSYPSRDFRPRLFPRPTALLFPALPVQFLRGSHSSLSRSPIRPPAARLRAPSRSLFSAPFLMAVQFLPSSGISPSDFELFPRQLRPPFFLLLIFFRQVGKHQETVGPGRLLQLTFR